MADLLIDADTAPPRRWPLWLIAAAAAAWILAATVVAAGNAQGTPFAWMLVAATFSAPLIVLLLLALLLRPQPAAAPRPSAGDTAAQVRAEVGELDALMSSIAARLEALRGSVAGDSQAFEASAGRLEAAAATVTDASRRAAHAANALDAHLPASATQIAGLSAALDTTADAARGRLAEIETMLAAMWSRHADAQAQAETARRTVADSLAAIDDAATRAAASVGERAAALDASVDRALDRTTTTLDAARDGVAVHSAALLATVEQARLALDGIGGEASRAIGKRFDRLLAAADQLGQQLADHDAHSQQMIDSTERSFKILDAKLVNATNSSLAALDGLAARTTAARDAIHQLASPIGETNAAMLDLEGIVTRLQGAAETTLALLGAAIPATGPELARLGGEVEALHAHAVEIGVPVAAGAAAIATAGAAFAAQRDAVESAAGRLVGELQAARTLVGEVEGQTEGAAIASAQRLIEVLGRVREVAAATAGTMRETLAGIVGEAEAALDRAGTERAEQAFGAPVRAQLAAVEDGSNRAADAAQAAAERVTQRLLGLTAAVASVEGRIDEAEAHYDVRQRDDLAKRSGVLLDSLAATSIDIAKFLQIDVADTAWAAYLKGDRSIFARQTVRLIDGGTARSIARHFKHDAAFREQATRYIDDFEQLLKRVMPDRDGKSLAITLLSSDLGKLYVALAQGTERLR